VLAAACTSKSHINVVSSPYADGVKHTEPVFYNGKHYDVSFRFDAHVNAYEVTVAGKGGRAIGGEAGDRAIAEAIAASTVRHFACASGQKAGVVAGSPRHAEGRWDMQARCG
jgi:hypothetical protein